MTIRPAVVGDVPRLVEMGMRFLRESEYDGRLKANPEAVTNLMVRLVMHEDGALFVSQSAGVITGMIGLHVFANPLSGERIAGELFWWVDTESRGHGLRLLSAAETWAKANGAVRIQMIAPNERVGRAYRARGYGKIEEQFQKDI